jgi:hypothetical protein
VERVLSQAERVGAITALGSLDDVWSADDFGRRTASELAGQLLGSVGGTVHV